MAARLQSRRVKHFYAANDISLLQLSQCCRGSWCQRASKDVRSISAYMSQCRALKDLYSGRLSGYWHRVIQGSMTYQNTLPMRVNDPNSRWCVGGGSSAADSFGPLVLLPCLVSQLPPGAPPPPRLPICVLCLSTSHTKLGDPNHDCNSGTHVCPVDLQVRVLYPRSIITNMEGGAPAITGWPAVTQARESTE